MSASLSNEWKPPAKIEELYKLGASAVNKFASINAPTAGARVEKPLEPGTAPFQLYSLATPNGVKVSIMLEELGIDYDAHFINIGAGDQFTSGFVAVNPNSKIPAAVDNDGPGGQPITLFESASIVMYLAEKHQRFLPTDIRLRTEVMNWVYWQMGGLGPMAGNFGHFFVYAPADKMETRDYGVTRYGMEVQRLLDVLDKHLEGRTYMVGDEYTVADIICFPWFQQLRIGYPHASSGISANGFLSVEEKYKHACKWGDMLLERPGVQRGRIVCSEGVGKPWLTKKE